MKLVTFPPGIWLTIAVGLEAFVQDKFPFPEYWWSPLVVLGLGFAAKLIQIYWPTPSPQMESNRGYLWTNRAWRFWIGG